MIPEHTRIALYLIVMVSLLLPILAVPSGASSGTEGAAFLDIPVGAGPAAMGAAYSALSDNAYAATLNPGGLGFLPATEFAAQHLAYVDTLHYEYVSFGLPLPITSRTPCGRSSTCAGSSLGGSIQYLGSGNVAGRDIMNQPTGDFSSHYASYNLAYGRAVSNRLSLGITGKWINAKLDDVSANAYALDFGSMFRATKNLTLAAVLTNMGTKLGFLNQRDSLPLAFHMGAAYQPMSQWNFSTEAVYRKTGLASFHLGIEWHPMPDMSLRSGYRTDTVKGLGALAGLTTGLGIRVHGQEFSYAWVPLGDLGSTHYFSLVLRLGEERRQRRNLIYFRSIKQHRLAQENPDVSDFELEQLLELPIIKEDAQARAKK